MGSVSTTFKERFKYYIHFLDDFRFTWIFPLKLKSEALFVFKNFQVMVERQFDSKIKCLYSYWGGEYRRFLPYLTSLRVQFKHSCPHLHQHIVEMGLYLLSKVSMPLVT